MTVHCKPILVTGCSSGIGLSAAEILQKRGYKVVASARIPEDVEALKERGLQHVVQLDLESSASIDSAIEQVLEITDGKLFALFNNGAYGIPGAVEDLSREALRTQFETNLFGTHELTVKLIPTLLKEKDARIVQNSSVLGFAAMPMRGAYNASKFALEGLTDTMRIELSETNIKVSLIEPGPIHTRFRENALAAMRRHIDFSKSRHRQRYEEALARLTKEGPSSKFTLMPEVVVDKLIHALESPRPKVRYYVTFPTYLFAYLRHILSYRQMDKLLLKVVKS
ncbi:SDR family NAD(P)-dependent oxidoreductase [Teredinibacter sp. KSP-S5-2]|uniref:SDR family NAD(P)-dependent oxidoreductase n=1 Tax=Teredinibacter sp. KSP-S5-2 TaxID=3034506 RepID=UPI0029342AED|nr:SDR family NAD(P)-dependent oxidoreductase [Teredinibacter sp. KSP-S5-2]WNO11045.1 SDR family NAD(P)-dependent oxidoreductase [Teredinibacter sp. KSP-S5-2]